MRDSCIFYRSFYEAIKELPTDSRAVLYDAIFSYSLDFIEPELSGLNKSIFTLIKPQLDANIKRYNNGTVPKVKPDKSKTKAKSKQNRSKTEANKNVNDNDNVNDNVNNKEIEEQSPTFIAFNKWIDKEAKDIRKIKTQITEDNFETLMANKKYNKDLLKDVIIAMANRVGIEKTHSSVYLTALNWMNIRLNNKPKEQPIKML